MNKQSMNLAKTIGIGVAASAAVAVLAGVSKQKHKNTLNIKKTAGKAVHTVGSLIGDVEKMLK